MRKQLNIQNITRFAIQLAFFIFLPALFSASFNGIKYLAEQLNDGNMITWNPFLSMLTILLASTIILGRFFCGYACAFGSLGDWIFTCSTFIQKKMRRKIFRLPDKVIIKLLNIKYLVLLGIIAACLTGIYSNVSHADPWELFASFRAGEFALNGKVYGALVLGLIIVGMAFVERFFCMFLCPLGAVFAILPILPFTTYNRKKSQCIPGCTLCIQTCPANISLGERNSKYGDCFQCGKCSVKCPKGNLRLGFRKFKGTEFFITIGKAAILFAVCYPIMGM